MVQAARSGKQNIAEGSVASGTSRETEIKLANVARAGLQELLVDYQDFVRVRELALWEKGDAKAQFIRRLGFGENGTYETYRTYVEEKSAETAANTIICLIHQTNYLLDQQIRAMEQAFVKEVGMRERMTRARMQERNGNDPR